MVSLARGKGKVRKSLLKRIAKGDICGAWTTDGRPCLGKPVHPGGLCRVHTAGSHKKLPPGVCPSVVSGKEATAATLLWHVYGRHLPPEQQGSLARITDNKSERTLDDVIALARLRLLLHVKRMTAGRYTMEEYETHCRDVGAELRQLLEANARLRQMEAELKKTDIAEAFGHDAFDPTDRDE